MLDTETKRRIDTCRDILVGKVPDPKSQVEQITIALIYKFMDDMDAEAEELGGKRAFFAGDFAKYGWAKLMAPNLGGYDVLNLYSEAIGKMNENPGVPALFRDIFKNAYLPYRDPETLRSFLKEINGFTYDHSERLGDAFEYLLSVLGSQGDAGQFRTPRHIIDFMVALIDPQKDETILDPACGTAGFLISAYKHILNANRRERPGDALTPDERKRLAGNFHGYDISPDMVRLSLVNLYLHGFANPRIEEYDTLTSEDRWHQYADVILANPPFMSPKGGIKPHKRFSIQANRSEVLFVDYIAEHLTPTGRAAVVVPEGIIFQSGTAYKQLRKLLVENYLVAVISLPAGVFNPYSGVKTSILFMDRKLAKKSDSLLFAKIENDGFGLGAQRRAIEKNDLSVVTQGVKAWLASVGDGALFDEAVNANVHLVAKARIGENGEWNLSGERYIKSQSSASVFRLVRLDEICQINPDSIDPATVFAGQDFEYIDISSVENETGTFDRGSIIPSKEAPSRARRKVISGDVLLSTVRPNLKAFTLLRSPSPTAVASTGFAVLRAMPDYVIPEFLLWLLRSQSSIDQMIGMMGKGAYPSINQKDVESIQIPLPPLAVQHEIVAEIEGYQQIIDGARQVVEHYRPRIVIEPAWPVAPLGDAATLRTGTTPDTSRSDYYIGDVNFIKTGEIINNVIDFALNHISRKAVEDYNLTIFPPGTILMAMYGQGKTRGQVSYLNIPACTTQNAAAITPDEQLDSKYLFFYLLTQYNNLRKHGIDGHISHLNLRYVKEFSIPLPDLATQRTIVAEIEEEQRLVAANRALIDRFTAKIARVINRVWEG